MQIICNSQFFSLELHSLSLSLCSVKNRNILDKWYIETTNNARMCSQQTIVIIIRNFQNYGTNSNNKINLVVLSTFTIISKLLWTDLTLNIYHFHRHNKFRYYIWDFLWNKLIIICFNLHILTLKHCVFPFHFQIM